MFLRVLFLLTIVAPNQLTFIPKGSKQRHIGITWQDFGCWRTVGVASVRQNQSPACAGYTFPGSSHGPTTGHSWAHQKGGEQLQAPEQGLPCSLERTMVEQVPHCSLWTPRAAAGGCVQKEAAAPGEQRHGRNCGLWRGAHTGADFLDLWPVGAPH